MAGIGTSGFGPGSSHRFSGFRHGSLDGRNNSFRYPSPWWDVAHMELPTTVKHLFRWCRYHVLVNPLVAATVRKMAAYPITEIILDESEGEGFDKNIKRWKDLLFRVLNMQSFQNAAGLDYNGYGNCVVSILYPFHKWLQCRHCKHRERIKKLKYKTHWEFKEFKYTLRCPKCKMTGIAKVEDKFYKSYRDIKLIRWNPSDLDIDFNPITQTTEYAYNVPGKVRNKVLRKNVRYLQELPDNFIQAMKRNRPIILTASNIFHFKAPTPSLSSNDAGWGYPPILPALKDSFYLQIMKKAQEAILFEHMVPLDIFYPASADANANPYTMINLSDWKRRIELEIIKWRWDPNYKPIMPLPVGYQRIGGDGKNMMLTQEIRAWSEHILAGMGVPQEFVFGGLSWTGSSVSLRMLENLFLNYRDMHAHFMRHFLIPNIARFMGWKEISVHMRPFKMADDIQSKQLLISLNQMRKISDKTLLSDFGKDNREELRLIEQETRMNLELQKLQQLYQAQMQGEAQLVQSKYQVKAQARMQQAQMGQMGGQPPQPGAEGQMGGQPQPGAEGQPGAAGQPGAPGQPGAKGQPGAQGGEWQQEGMNVINMADAYARKISRLPPEQSAQVLQQMQQQSPQLHELVMQKMQFLKAMNQEPLPEQRPPRRESTVI